MATTKTLVLALSGPVDPGALCEAVSSAGGVRGVNPLPELRRLRVRYFPDQTTPEAIIAAVRALGVGTEVVEP